MRTFIAVGISDDITGSIAGLQSGFRKHDFDIKYVKPENIHVTLKFLGEVEENRISEVYESVKDSVGDTKKFNIIVDSVGVFPGPRSPKVIWAGVSEGSRKLKDLNRTIEGSLVSAGFKKEKKIFSAHLTIGRVRSSKNIKLLSNTVEEMCGVRIGRMLVEDVLVMKSDLTSQGPVYTVLKKVMLK